MFKADRDPQSKPPKPKIRRAAKLFSCLILGATLNYSNLIRQTKMDGDKK